MGSKWLLSGDAIFKLLILKLSFLPIDRTRLRASHGLRPLGDEPGHCDNGPSQNFEDCRAAY